MNTGSFILSILLHVGFLVFLLYAPAHKPVDLTRPSVQVSLVMGLPGGENLPSPVLGHRPPEAEKQVLSTETAPKPEATAEPAPSMPETPSIPTPEALRQNMPQPTDEPATPNPPEEQQPQPEQVIRPQEAVNIPRPDAQPEKKPEPKPEPEKKAEPKPEPVKKPEPKPEQKSAPEPEKKPAPKQEKKPEPIPDKKPSKPVNAAADALAEVRKQARSGQNSGKGSAAASALKDLAREITQTGVGGGGGQGDGPGGGGIYDVFAGLVMEAVRPNWSIPVMSRSNMVVQVRIKVDRNGNVQDCSIEQSSGRPEFDASAVNAVKRTSERGMFPKPPTRAQQDILINFNSQDLIR